MSCSALHPCQNPIKSKMNYFLNFDGMVSRLFSIIFLLRAGGLCPALNLADISSLALNARSPPFTTASSRVHSSTFLIFLIYVFCSKLTPLWHFIKSFTWGHRARVRLVELGPKISLLYSLFRAFYTKCCCSFI